MKRFLLVVPMILLAALTACEEDAAKPQLKKASNYADLTEKSHVLQNLQQAMRDMNAERYAELLDPNDFTFFFSPGDIGQEHIPPSGEWYFDEEKGSAETMFGGLGGVNNNPVLSIELTLDDYMNANWVEFNPLDFPGLYRASVRYSFNFDTKNDTQYITSGTPRAEFTVKQEEVNGKMIWRLVMWGDFADIFATDAGAAGTEETNWSRVKALYQGPGE